MKSTTLKSILAAAIIMTSALVTPASAENKVQWFFIDSIKSDNISYELNLSSIEQISPSIKRAVTRHKRLDPNVSAFLGLSSSAAAPIHYVEMVNDFDCETPRRKNGYMQFEVGN